jgi:hypothetical protein
MRSDEECWSREGFLGVVVLVGRVWVVPVRAVGEEVMVAASSRLDDPKPDIWLALRAPMEGRP